MKNIYESVFMSSVRALFISFFAIVGIVMALLVVVLTYQGLSNVEEESSLSSKIKMQPNAEGHRGKFNSNVPSILQISIDGEIGKEKLTGKYFEELLLETQENTLKNHVKGIFLVINSPGGGVNDSDAIYRLLKEYKDRYHIPVYAFIDGMCASGGYYMACAADKIFATDVSLIGSIGVLSWPPFINLSDAMKKIGISSLTLSAGLGKDEMNPFRVWEPEEEKHYQTLLNFYYNRFVDIVSSHRHIERDHLINSHGAKVYPAHEAWTIGLIDEEGYSKSQALKELAIAAGIEKKYQVIGLETKSWISKLFKDDWQNYFFIDKLKQNLAFPICHDNPFKYLFIPGQ